MDDHDRPGDVRTPNDEGSHGQPLFESREEELAVAEGIIGRTLPGYRVYRRSLEMGDPCPTELVPLPVPSLEDLRKAYGFERRDRRVVERPRGTPTIRVYPITRPGLPDDEYRTCAIAYRTDETGISGVLFSLED